MLQFINRQIQTAALILCATLSVFSASAQSIKYSMGYQTDVNFKGRVVDSLTLEPLPAAVISVIAKFEGTTSVRNFVADDKGYFKFGCSSTNHNRMEVSVLGYKPKLVYLATDRDEYNLDDIRLSHSTEDIDEVVVKARIQMFKIKGDTVIYVPRAVATMKDDAVGEILRNMPGVEVSDKGVVTILGKTVERTYVNQKLLFGEDPSVAINQIEAKEVASIQSYDEIDEVDAIKNGNNARKRKVLNIVTFKEFTQSMHANVRGELGADFSENVDGKRPVRYGISGEGGYYSETMQASLKASSDNATMSRPSYMVKAMDMRETDVSANVSGRVGAQHNYRAAYSFTNTKRDDMTSSINTFFPTPDLASQRILDTIRRQQRSSLHYISADYRYTSPKSSLDSRLTARLGSSNDIDEQRQQTLRDEAFLSSDERLTTSRKSTRSVNWSLGAEQKFSELQSLGVNFSVNWDNDPSHGLFMERRIDATNPFIREQDIYLPTRSNRVAAGIRYGLNFDKKGRVDLLAEVQHNNRSERRLYTDLATGEVDTPRSEDAVDMNNHYLTKATYLRRMGEMLLVMDIGYNLEDRRYDDKMVGTTTRRQFHYVTAMVSLGKMTAKRNYLLNATSKTKSVEGRDLSSSLNDANPSLIRTGNVMLRPEKSYDISFDDHFTIRQSSLYYTLAAAAITDPVVQRRTYFRDATPLPEYNGYVVPAGATLQRPENGASFISLSSLVGYKRRIAPLRLFANVEVSHTYSNPQEVLNDEVGRANIHLAKLSLELTTNFSTRLRFKVKNSVGIFARRALGYSSHDFNNRLDASCQWDVVDNLFFRTEYSGVYRSASMGFAIPSTHLLNASLGYRVFKERGRFAINAYDLLNNFSGYTVSQNTQGVIERQSRVGSNYFTVSFEYKFTNRKTTN